RPLAPTAPPLPDSGKSAVVASIPAAEPASSVMAAHVRPGSPDRVLRLTAENLNRLLSLAGESLVESRWLRPFADSLQRLKRQQSEMERTLDGLRLSLDARLLDERSAARLTELFQHATETRQYLSERLQELDLFDSRSAHLS